MASVLPSPQQGSSGAKKSPDYLRVASTNEGVIEIGKLNLNSASGSLNSSVTSGIHLQGKHPLHYMSFDNDGPRQGWTLNRSPGPYQILCATETCGSTPNLPSDNNSSSPEEGAGFIVVADKGDIILHAPKGRIRLSALDVQIYAEGHDNTRGTILLDSNECVKIDSPRFEAKCDIGISLFSPSSITLATQGTMSMAGNFTEGISAASNLTFSLVNPTGPLKFFQLLRSF